MPLLASQLGHPVSLGGTRGVNGGVVVSAASAAHLMAQALPPLAAMPTGDGKIMARNINGTCKYLLSVVKFKSLIKGLHFYVVLFPANAKMVFACIT